jgi:CHAT domain-containing protein
VSALAELRAQLPSDEVAFRRGVAPLHASLVDLLLLRAAEVGEDERQRLLVEARAALEELKATELRDYFRDPCLDAQRKATPDVVPRTLVVYPIALPGRVELIVGEGGELARYATPVSGEVFEDEVRAFRRTLEKLTTREYLAHARNLYDWMIRPLAPRLEQGPIDTLVFVPGGALRTVPLAALSDRETGRFLIERYPVAITPSLTLMEPRAIDRSGVRVLAGGLSESVQGFTALENVPREIDALSAVFPAQRLLNGEFLARHLERELASQPFGIVHIASHGEFAPDASRSYVLTYDEKVPMERVAAWVATTRFREQWPLELLALSACQTAVGDERAALGLAGLALRSGARSALATLWSVDDQASADLVSEFYARLREPGLSRAQALQLAQLKLMRTYQFRHPAFWSPFLLIGSWL